MKNRATLFSVLQSVINAASLFGTKLGTVILYLMVSLITVDVIGRFFFDRPTYVADELSGYSLVAIIFLSLAQVQKEKRHIVSGVLIDRLKPDKRKWLEISTYTIALAFVVWFTWSTATATIQSYVLGTSTQTILRTPYWIPKLMLPLGFGLFALQLAMDIVKLMRSGNTRDSSPLTRDKNKQFDIEKVLDDV